MRIMVDQTFWLSLLDENDQNHAKSQKIFSDILAENNTLYITNYIFNETVFQIRKNFSNNQEEILQIFEDAIHNNYLKILFIGRITQKDINRFWKKYPDWPFQPLDLANISIMKKRFIPSMLSWRQEYKDLNINVLNL
ncbi:MAG: PIN domain-containing protein [Calditrichia bacterium]|nr:PIN domain-containing protein [Calditrichia bacterium]